MQMSTKTFDSDIFRSRVLALKENKIVTAKEIVDDRKGQISLAWFSKLKNNSIKSPSADIIFMLADYFGVSTDYILGLSDIKSPYMCESVLNNDMTLTDEQIEAEIERLNASEAVALARRESRLKYQRLYQLRDLEKKGKALMAAGITREILDEMYRSCDEEVIGNEKDDCT